MALPDRRSLHTIRRRRAELRAALDPARRFAELEESMVPSYCHANPLAAGVAWWRLLAARELAGDLASRGPLLDFGAASGELYELLDQPRGYHFVEENEALAEALARRAAGSVRLALGALPEGAFGTVFALDALEHNEDPAAIVAALARSLAPDGLLIVSGPTESALYRLGRRVAGFAGHYHHHDVYAVEALVAGRLARRALRSIPPLVPLFRLSAWSADQLRGLPADGTVPASRGRKSKS